MLVSRLTSVLFLAATLSACVSLQIPTGYYNTVDQSGPQRLRETVHAVIDDHTRFPYTSTATDTWNVVASADEDPGNTANVLTVSRSHYRELVDGMFETLDRLDRRRVGDSSRRNQCS